MKNPWLKKNPLMSMWLSGANAMVGSARGSASANAQRQARALVSESARQMMAFWSGGTLAKPRSRRKR